jgi:hypothetical protein
VVGRARKDTRLADIPGRSWLWIGVAACVLLGTLWLARTLREKPRASTATMIATTDGQEAEIVVENAANSGTARHWTQTIGTLAAFTAVIFIYSMAR